MTGVAFRALAREAAQRYPARDRFARHFAFGKLTGDPVFEHIVREGLLPSGAAIVDLGCGQGLLAALLSSAGHDVRRLRGIDLMARDVERARAAATGAEFLQGDIRTTPLGRAERVVILDVLHYVDLAAQEDVLRRVREALGGGGTLLLRVGDANGSLRFRWTVFIDKLVTALRGHRIARLHCRPVAEWVRLLQELGFAVEAVPMSKGTGFANVLLVARDTT